MHVRAVYLLFMLGGLARAFTLTGTVTTIDGKPLSGAQVWLNQDRTPKKTVCKEDGTFQFENVAVGPVEIVAWKPGLSCGGLDARVAGDANVAIALGEPDAIVVHTIERRIDPLTAVPGPPSSIVGASVLVMYVNDAFHVSVQDLAPLGFPNPRSDDKGILRIDMVPKGSYVSFTITHREYAEQRIPSYPAGGRELTLPMLKGISLGGRITNEKREGVAGARVSIVKSGPPPLKEYKETRADADGFYSVLVEPSDYFVVARHPGYATTTPVRVSVHGDLEETTCDVSLSTGYRVIGYITGKDDNPVGGVTVQYVADDMVYDETLTGPDGKFMLTAGPGAGTIHIIAPTGYIAGKGTDVEIKVLNQDVTLTDPVRITELPEITGTITDETGAPQSNVIVSSVNLDPPQWTVSDTSGAFSLRLTEAPRGGEAAFRAEHSRRFTRKDFTVTFADLKPQIIKLEPFDPNLAPCDPSHTFNKLDGFRNRQAPEIDCKQWFNLAGEAGAASKLTLASLRGNVVVLIFWGGFDTTAKGLTRLRQMNTLYEAFRDAGDVKFVGIHDSASDSGEVTAYVHDNNVAYPVGIDNETVTFDRYDIFAIPQIVLIDKKGLFRYYDVEGRLLELIKSLRREAS